MLHGHWIQLAAADGTALFPKKKKKKVALFGEQMQSSLKLTHAAKIMRAGIYEALNSSGLVSLHAFFSLLKSNTHTQACTHINLVVQPAQ